MVVELRVAQVLVRQVPQLLDRGLDVRPALGDGGQKLAQAVLFDGVKLLLVCGGAS